VFLISAGGQKLKKRLCVLCALSEAGGEFLSKQFFKGALSRGGK
jgi:hypothetical protein